VNSLRTGGYSRTAAVTQGQAVEINAGKRKSILHSERQAHHVEIFTIYKNPISDIGAHISTGEMPPGSLKLFLTSHASNTHPSSSCTSKAHTLPSGSGSISLSYVGNPGKPFVTNGTAHYTRLKTSKNHENTSKQH